jgi:hypothetical protein
LELRIVDPSQNLATSKRNWEWNAMLCAKAGREAQSTSQSSADTAVQKVRQARSSPSFDEHTLSSAFLAARQ